MNRIAMDLQFFAEEGAAAAAGAPESGGGTADPGMAAETQVPEGPIGVGDTLADGQKVQSAQVAAELERQMKRHPNLRNVYRGKGAAATAAAAPAAPEPAQETQEDEQTPDENAIQQQEWDELKKGRFRDLYGADVQKAVQERFKNQQNLQQQLDDLQPMLQAAMKLRGVNSVDELKESILNDDSLYEQEAEEKGMTIENLKAFKQIEAENSRLREQERQSYEQIQLQRHFEGLIQQAQELKKEFPDFDLDRELQNPDFFRLTKPGVGVKVRDAYFAIHHNELAPQMMAYGMQRAQQQMSQTIQANARRPVEGATRSQGTAADMKIDPRRMTRAERDEIRKQIHAGKRVSFD